MGIIKRIRIKNFRSIVDETFELENYNCFVGKNDSGKSNVLKALNLFFNGKTDLNNEYDFCRDYSKFAKQGKKQAKEITITVVISMPENFHDAGEKTWIKIWRQDGLYSNNIGSLFEKRSKGRTFLERVKYQYIPAVKSDEYFKLLLSEVYMSMTQTANSELKTLNDQYSAKLETLTTELSNDLKNSLGLKSIIQLPQDLRVLFRDLSFLTSDSFVQNIDLSSRGDGIKARHIPTIIKYMQRNEENNRKPHAIPCSYMWGFEEPENGVEVSSGFDLANELSDYASSTQLLITTHSPAFYMKGFEMASRVFYVYKNESGISKYEISNEVKTIDKNIGLLPVVAPYVAEIQKKYLQSLSNIKEAEEKINTLNEALEDVTNKLLVITEGKTDIKHIKTAFNSIELEREFLDRIEYYDFGDRGTLGDDLPKLLERISHMPQAYKVVGVFDRDKHVEANDPEKSYKSLGNNVYRFNIPPVAPRGQDASICIEHYFTDEEIKKVTEHGRLYMGNDFNEFGLSNDGKIVFKGFDKYNASNKTIMIVDGNNKNIQKMERGQNIITKDEFADFVETHPEEFTFESFRDIFCILKEIMSET